MSTHDDPSTVGSAAEFLLGRINYELSGSMPYEARFLKLERVRELLKQLGDPHLHLPAIHIAGSKGKGSVAAMVAGLLTAAGVKTGLFTSPHLERLEERLTIDGRICPADEFERLVHAVRPAVDRIDGFVEHRWERPTFFETITAMALKYFAEQGVEVAVLETGLGGRLDATNVCQPRVAVITSISRDHTKQLGDRLADIAAEKAGIIKAGVPVISADLPAEAMGVVEEVCQIQAAPLLRLGRDFACRKIETQSLGTRFEYSGLSTGGVWRSVSTPLIGRHQAANASLALAAVETWFADRGAQALDLADLAARCWPQIGCPARVEVVSHEPPTILDAAHNEASVDALIDSLEACFPGRRWTVIFGTSADKEIEAMLRRLIPWAVRLIVTRYQSNPRGADARQLYRQAVALSGPHAAAIEVAETPEQAWQWARDGRPGDGAICVTGSFFLAAEMRTLVAPASSSASLPQQG